MTVELKYWGDVITYNKLTNEGTIAVSDEIANYAIEKDREKTKKIMELRETLSDIFADRFWREIKARQN